MTSGDRALRVDGSMSTVMVTRFLQFTKFELKSEFQDAELLIFTKS